MVVPGSGSYWAPDTSADLREVTLGELLPSSATIASVSLSRNRSTHKVPRRWFFVDGYPLTPSGKVQKFRLRQLVDDGTIAEARATAET